MRASSSVIWSWGPGHDVDLPTFTQLMSAASPPLMDTSFCHNAPDQNLYTPPLTPPSTQQPFQHHPTAAAAAAETEAAAWAACGAGTAAHYRPDHPRPYGLDLHPSGSAQDPSSTSSCQSISTTQTHTQAHPWVSSFPAYGGGPPPEQPPRGLGLPAATHASPWASHFAAPCAPPGSSPRNPGLPAVTAHHLLAAPQRLPPQPHLPAAAARQATQAQAQAQAQAKAAAMPPFPASHTLLPTPALQSGLNHPLLLPPTWLPPRQHPDSSFHSMLLDHHAPSAPRPASTSRALDPRSVESASALTSPLSVPSPGEEQLQQELESARRQLDMIVRAVQDNSTAKWKEKFAETLPQVQRLVETLAAEVQRNQQLQQRHRRVSMQLASAERELRWCKMTATETETGGARGGAAALSSVLQLPPAAEWDAAWDERVRRLQTLDIVDLHRQWLQHSSMLLPKAQVLGGTPMGKEVTQQLHELYERYDCFSQRVMRLVPEHWSASVLYSLDTMQQLQRPPNPLDIHKMLLAYAPETCKKLLPIQLHYAEVLARLQQQRARMEQDYAQLAAGAGANAGAAWAQGGRDVEADEVLRRLQANLLQQQLQRAAFVHAINFGLPVEAMLQMKLLMYPLAENGQVVTHQDYVSSVQAAAA